jgi:nanoRNase/pAp phosphatase (c-di-AMP/oligoRNAs hydrolase)
MLNSKFECFLSFIKNKKILIIPHDLVDIDGLVSCFTLKYFLNQYFKDQKIFIFFSEFLKSSRIFLERFHEKFPDFSISYEENVDFSLFDVILIVDTNNINQIQLNNNYKIQNLGIPYVFIDHHYIVEKTGEDKPNLIFENYSSTAEIILDLFKLYDIPITTPLKILLISAILTDSGFFKHGSNKSVQNVGQLLSEEIKIQDIFTLLKIDIDISQKVANIKGLQRLEMIREGDYLIGLTNVSSFGSSIASMLLKIGFDVGIVISKELNQSRISTRAKKRVCIKTGLNLGKILVELSKKYEGSGGGHDGAASLTVDIEPDPIITDIIKKIRQHF